MKRARAVQNKRRHNSLRELRLYNPHTTDGIDQPRRISREEGEQMVEAGTAVRRFDTFNHHSGYNLCAEAPRSEQTPLAPSSCVFSMSEVEAIAFQIFDDGRSYTARVSEPQKLERVAQKRRAEDYVELAAAKIEQWPRPIEKTTPDKAGEILQTLGRVDRRLGQLLLPQ